MSTALLQERTQEWKNRWRLQKKHRRVKSFFVAIEKARQDFDRAPVGSKYEAFFAGIDRAIEKWQAFNAAEVKEGGDAGPA